MTVSLPTYRVLKITDACEQLLRKSREKIQGVARVIGLLVAAIPAVEMGKLHCGQLEMAKITALQTEKGNFDQWMAYPKDAALCVCVTLRQYLGRTEALKQGTVQEHDNLLISFIKPHKGVTRNIIAHWIKTMLDKSGMDTTKFTAGSVCAAATSKAKTMAVPVSCIMARAGWTRGSTFAKFYDKHIGTIDLFQDAVQVEPP
ncbi:hypothetical protein E2C01_045597 [Portunus trituberculatus]|uniref:Tyr recombinase domain-containing protein n=1 Tax=Portunus trituberculatus TaxID=210409 RepID=A0A5B7G5G7_PORTR|nr:hypothetical protein [Portunus trituberculatus]